GKGRRGGGESAISSRPPPRPADLPDWRLALLEGDRQQEPGHELIIAASLIHVRRGRPGIRFDTARARIAESAAEPARLEDLSGRIEASRPSRGFERPGRSGRFGRGGWRARRCSLPRRSLAEWHCEPGEPDERPSPLTARGAHPRADPSRRVVYRSQALRTRGGAHLRGELELCRPGRAGRESR